MPGAAAERRMTVAEFLTWDDGTDTRYELIDGVPVAMAPPQTAHGTIQARLSGRIDRALEGRPPCRPITEAGVVSPRRSHTFFVADIAVTCAPHRRDADHMVTDPILLVEILSEGTDREVRRVKLPEYRLIPGLREILLVDSRARFAELHRRLDGERWLVDLARGDEAVLRLESVGADVPLGALYAGLELEDEEPAGPPAAQSTGS